MILFAIVWVSVGILAKTSRDSKCSCCRLIAPSPIAWELSLVESVISFEEEFQDSAHWDILEKPVF